MQHYISTVILVQQNWIIILHGRIIYYGILLVKLCRDLYYRGQSFTIDYVM